jgi:predicted RNA-binding Zn-ribbon protein involved in translation (DUF1610 family)
MAADSHDDSRTLTEPRSQGAGVSQQRHRFEHCSACGTTLKRLVTSGISVHRCPSCKGTWIHMQDFKQLAQQDGDALAKFLE